MSDRLTMPRSRFRQRLLAAVLLSAWGVMPGRADEPATGSFSSLLDRHDRAGFLAARDWATANPDHPEAHDAHAWCYSTAYERGWYADVLALSERLIAAESVSDELRKRARQLRCLGLAATGDSDAAIDAWGELLKGVRLRAPNETLDVAFSLSAQLQIAGDAAAAQEVLKSTANAFFLNEEIRTLCDRRIAKLLLLGSMAEDFSWVDVTGNAGRLGDLRGRFVLVDFWATNCAPCLADLPALKSVYHRFRERGFQIVGLSLDRTEQEVRQFQSERRIGWPLALVTSSGENPREKYRVVTIPATFLLDSEGKIVLVDGTARDVGLMLEKLTAESSATIRPAIPTRDDAPRRR